MNPNAKGWLHDLLIIIAITVSGGCWYAISGFVSQWEVSMSDEGGRGDSISSKWRDSLGDEHVTTCVRGQSRLHPGKIEENRELLARWVNLCADQRREAEKAIQDRGK